MEHYLSIYTGRLLSQLPLDEIDRPPAESRPLSLIYNRRLLAVNCPKTTGASRPVATGQSDFLEVSS
jgi:hypothetical protein